MRRALFLVLLAAPAPAGEAEAEKLALARLAFEARVKLADLDLAQGKRAEAVVAYAAAAAAFRAELDALAPAEEEAIGLGGGVGRAFGGRAGVRAGPAPAVNAVERGLVWLAAHQDEDGRWDADGFTKHDPEADAAAGAGQAFADVGVTSLALLAFLGAGYNDRRGAAANPYGKHVRLGLRYLLAVQAEDGFFGPRDTVHAMYNHALATLALCEAFALTRNPRYRKPAQDGVNYLLRARNPGRAWRYGPRTGENDTSVTAWCVLALKSAGHAGLEVEADAFEGARAWVDSVTDKDFGRVGYNLRGGVSARPEGLQERFPPERTHAMTAAGILIRVLTGEDPRRSEAIAKGAKLCLEAPPNWGEATDMYYWYFGTLAMFQMGREEWRAWSEAMKTAIVKSQHGKEDGHLAGSWSPDGVWARSYGGRVYSTALMTLSLEVYYRYDNATRPR